MAHTKKVPHPSQNVLSYMYIKVQATLLTVRLDVFNMFVCMLVQHMQHFLLTSPLINYMPTYNKLFVTHYDVSISS